MLRALIVTGVIACTAAPVVAQETGTPTASLTTWGTDVVLSSAYVWRGEAELTGLNTQPSFWVGVGPVSLSSWMAIDGAGVYEHDAAVEFARGLGPLSAKVGWVNYFVPSAEDGRYTNDLYAGAEFPWRVTPSVTYWRGVEAESDRYVETALSTRVGNRVTVEPRLALGRTFSASPDGDASHVETTLTFEWAFRGLAVRPFISHIAGLDARIGRRTYGGLQVAFEQ